MNPEFVPYKVNYEDNYRMILDKFNPTFFIETVKLNLTRPSMMSFEKIINSVNLIDLNYTENINNNADDFEVVNTLREERHRILCDFLETVRNIVGISIDPNTYDRYQILFSVSSYTFEIFVDYGATLVKFFSSFIDNNKQYIYNKYDIDQFRKNKDTTTTYNKRFYKDTKIALIISNLDYVIPKILSENFTFDVYLKYLYNNQQISGYLDYINIDIDSYLKYVVGELIIKDTVLYHNFIHNIRKRLTDTYDVTSNMDIQNFIDTSDEEVDINE